MLYIYPGANSKVLKSLIPNQEAFLQQIPSYIINCQMSEAQLLSLYDQLAAFKPTLNDREAFHARLKEILTKTNEEITTLSQTYKTQSLASPN